MTDCFRYKVHSGAGLCPDASCYLYFIAGIITQGSRTGVLRQKKLKAQSYVCSAPTNFQFCSLQRYPAY